jgi:NAD(P) transhydrogenase subunit alpha
VALTPDVVRSLKAKELEVAIESGRRGAGHPDAQYSEADASVDPGDGAWGADVVTKVAVPTVEEIARLRSGQVLVGHLAPLTSGETNRALAEAGVTAFAMEAIPRITRAQVMDALSSQANLAGYRAVIEAAEAYGRVFPMMMTAAGTVAAAKVFVMGVGVAGLQAIATARRLGANVVATDVRPEVKEQIERVGAKYVGIELKDSAAEAEGLRRPLTERRTRGCARRSPKRPEGRT